MLEVKLAAQQYVQALPRTKSKGRAKLGNGDVARGKACVNKRLDSSLKLSYFEGLEDGIKTIDSGERASRSAESTFITTQLPT